MNIIEHHYGPVYYLYDNHKNRESKTKGYGYFALAPMNFLVLKRKLLYLYQNLKITKK